MKGKVKGKICILLPMSLKFVPRGLIDNELALVQVMAWHKTHIKPLPDPVLTQIYIVSQYPMS